MTLRVGNCRVRAHPLLPLLLIVGALSGMEERLLPSLKSASIHQEIFGSDHCPVEIIMEF